MTTGTETQERRMRGRARRAEVRAALARSAAWVLLSRAFGDPEAGAADALQPPRLLLAEVPGVLPEAVQGRVAALLAGADALQPGELAGIHRRLFTHTRSADCPQYEVPYRTGEVFQETQELADINGFYRAFGFATGAQRRERADHIAVETEFLHAISLLHAVALGEGDGERASVCEQAYRHFLRDHAMSWMPTFADRVMALARESAPFYASAGELLHVLLGSEAARLRLTLGPVIDELPAAAEPREDDSSPLIQFSGVFGREG